MDSQIIQLNKGWNLIGICLSNIEIENLFNDKRILKIKDFNNNLYELGIPSQFNTLNKLEHGKGYMIESSESFQIKVNGDMLQYNSLTPNELKDFINNYKTIYKDRFKNFSPDDFNKSLIIEYNMSINRNILKQFDVKDLNSSGSNSEIVSYYYPLTGKIIGFIDMPDVINSDILPSSFFGRGLKSASISSGKYYFELYSDPDLLFLVTNDVKTTTRVTIKLFKDDFVFNEKTFYLSKNELTLDTNVFSQLVKITKRFYNKNEKDTLELSEHINSEIRAYKINNLPRDIENNIQDINNLIKIEKDKIIEKDRNKLI